MNARVNWLQVLAIVAPLAMAGLGFAVSVDKRVTVVEERLKSHVELPTHPNSELRLTRLEARDAELGQTIRNVESNQAELKLLIRELMARLDKQADRRQR